MKENKHSYKVRLQGTDTWTEIPVETFNSLSLEDGTRMPEMQGNKVIITNYFNTFWGRVMGARNFRVFMVLSQFAYGGKDYSYPSLQTMADICDMSVNTVKAAIKALEELGFVIQVQVYNNDKEENENNIYIIRKTTPFLSVDQYKTLPKKLQEMHRKYIRNIEESERISLSNAPDYPTPSKPDKGTSKSARGGSKIDIPPSTNVIPDEVVDNVGNVDKYDQIGGSNFDVPASNVDVGQNLTEGVSEIDGGVGQILTPNKYNLLSTTNLNQLNNHHHSIPEIQESVFAVLKTQLSKPSFDTWISSLTFLGIDDQRGVLSIYAEHELQKEWVESRYTKVIKNVLLDLFNLDLKINVTLNSNRTR